MRCKLGDLCIMVRSRYPANLGLIVKIIARSQWPDEWDWYTESLGRPIQGDVDRLYRSSGPHSQAKDWQLRPLPGDVTDHDEPAQARVPAGERA